MPIRSAMSTTLRRCQALLCLGVVMLLSACASVPRPAAQIAPGSAPPYDAWARVLERYVDDEGRIDFVGVSRDRADLDRFVAWVYDTGPNNQPALFPTPADVLAYHLNAYNALAMHKVLEKNIPQTLAGLRKVAFFYFGKVRIGGEPMTLYAYENDVIRKIPDPRLHVALNCMVRGCPRLPREPFLPERLEEQLNRESRRFYNEERNVQVDEASRTVRLSSILEFYTEDFLAAAPSLPAYVNMYRDSKVPEDYKVEFIPYNWIINRQAGK